MKSTILILALFVTAGCADRKEAKIEMLVPKECASNAIVALGLKGDIAYSTEYVLFDNSTYTNEIFPGYLKIKSSKYSKEHLMAIANGISVRCLPEQKVEFSQSMDTENLGSSIATFAKNPKNKLFLLYRDEAGYKLISNELQPSAR